MRAFIAVELPEDIRGSLARIQEKLKTAQADVKWVEPQNIHLTIKFLGERDDKKIEKIMQILEETASDKKAFQACICSIGVFPKVDFPRVIWLGIDKGDSEIKTIAKELEEKIAKIGIPKEERPFSSHITIGRTKSALNRENLVQCLKKTANDFEMERLEFNITRLTLFKSTLGPKGPTYEALKVANLIIS